MSVSQVKKQGRYFATRFFTTKKKAESAVSWLKKNGGTYINVTKENGSLVKRFWRVRANIGADKIQTFFDLSRW